MNPRKMQGMMKKMGIAQTELDAKQVIIKLEDKELVFNNPNVSKVNMMGQDTFQLVGDFEERSLEPEIPEISEEDIKTVVQQANCSKEQAKTALEENDGDMAAAILKLQENQ